MSADPTRRFRDLLKQLLADYSGDLANELVKKYNNDPAFHMVCHLAIQAQMRVEELGG